MSICLMNFGGGIECRTISNAYGCCCQLLSRMKPLVENAEKMLKKDNPNFQYFAFLVDISTQIKEGYTNIDVSPLIHMCDIADKQTADFITLFSSLIFYLAPDFASEYEVHPIFTSQLFNCEKVKFEKSQINDIELPPSQRLDKIITTKYSSILSPSSFLFFKPLNSFSFHLCSMLQFNLGCFFLSTLVVRKKENIHHYVLFLADSKKWVKFDDNEITFTELNELDKICMDDNYEIVIIGFTQSSSNIDMTLIQQKFEQPTILQPIESDSDLHNIDEIIPNKTIQKTSQNENQNQNDNEKSLYQNIKKENDKRITSINENRFQVSAKRKNDLPDNKTFISNNDLIENSSRDDIYDSYQKYIASFYVFLPGEMNFKLLKTKVSENYEESLKKIFSFLKKNRASNYLFKYDKDFKYHRTLKNIKNKKELNVYFEKKPFNIMNTFISKSKEIVKLHLQCIDINALKTTAIFSKLQFFSTVKEYIIMFMNQILPNTKVQVELFYKARNEYIQIGNIDFISDKTSENRDIIYFKYTVSQLYK
ncbi:hypothetical protein TRFO_22665 [Tritrichomonas foetus]|uniref:Uncharacterized protein n=1 Tax=Tritrichomonas foetus TaxID=1144522 RepID=A0A1J4KGG3_9EUKA|nr:hypothetical protein TRFO_22665 [Tritrichomonas foetus]|eukprot:OHT08750.1 hypothetical protein TRFO_22665 [Tritrichomonas foetus]